MIPIFKKAPLILSAATTLVNPLAAAATDNEGFTLTIRKALKSNEVLNVAPSDCFIKGRNADIIRARLSTINFDKKSIMILYKSIRDAEKQRYLSKKQEVIELVEAAHQAQNNNPYIANHVIHISDLLHAKLDEEHLMRVTTIKSTFESYIQEKNAELDKAKAERAVIEAAADGVLVKVKNILIRIGTAPKRGVVWLARKIIDLGLKIYNAFNR